MPTQKEIYNYTLALGDKDRQEIIKDIADRAIVPYQLEVHPPPRGTKVCWMECPWCYGLNHAIDLAEKISSERLLEVLKEINSQNLSPILPIRKVVFSGVATDPLYTNPGLMESMIKNLIEYGVEFGIHTKLLNISLDLIDIVLSSVNEGRDYISVSLDAGTSGTYNAVYNVKSGNPFDRVIKNISNITSQCSVGKPKIVATYLLDNHNAKRSEIIAAVIRCQEVGVQSIRFSVPQKPYSLADDLHFEMISDQNIALAKEVIMALNDTDIEVIFMDYHEAPWIQEDRILPCHSQWIYPTIGIDGYLYPCCQVATSEFKELRLADLKSTSFWSAYYTYTYQDAI